MRDACAGVLQMWWRGLYARLVLASLHADRAAVAEAERQYELEEAGAMAVQSIWRGQAARKRVGELMGASDAASQAELEEACAVMVQCAWRSRHSRSLVSSLHADRAAVAEAERQYELEEAGATAVQSMWRGHDA